MRRTKGMEVENHFRRLNIFKDLRLVTKMYPTSLLDWLNVKQNERSTLFPISVNKKMRYLVKEKEYKISFPDDKSKISINSVVYSNGIWNIQNIRSHNFNEINFFIHEEQLWLSFNPVGNIKLAMMIEPVNIVVNGKLMFNFIHNNTLFTLEKNGKGFIFDRLCSRIMEIGTGRQSLYRFIDRDLFFQSHNRINTTPQNHSTTIIGDEDKFTGRIKLSTSHDAPIMVEMYNIKVGKYFLDTKTMLMNGNTVIVITSKEKIVIIDGNIIVTNFKSFSSIGLISFNDKGVMDQSSLRSVLLSGVIPTKEEVTEQAKAVVEAAVSGGCFKILGVVAAVSISSLAFLYM
jgi:hypothetical protein